MDYLSEIQVYKNLMMPIDTYVFHYGLSQWYQALVVRSVRRVLKNIYKTDIPLVETFNIFLTQLEKRPMFQKNVSACCLGIAHV